VRVVHPCSPPVNRFATTTFGKSARMNNLLRLHI
jgi:hypothetical protein